MTAHDNLREILRACALEYGGEGAPIVRWYAEGDAAKAMVETARRHGIQVKPEQEESLLLALKTVKVNTEIPREIYLAVARIYAYLLSSQSSAQTAVSPGVGGPPGAGAEVRGPMADGTDAKAFR